MEAEQATFFRNFYSGAGGEVDECSIMLRFFGDDLEPDAITALLGVPPTDMYRKGDFRSKTGRSLNWPKGFWLLHCERTTDTADHQIKLLLEVDLPADLKIWKSLTNQFIAEMHVHLSLARWNRGTNFSVETVQLLAERGLRLSLDIYSKWPPPSVLVAIGEGPQ